MMAALWFTCQVGVAGHNLVAWPASAQTRPNRLQPSCVPIRLISAYVRRSRGNSVRSPDSSYTRSAAGTVSFVSTQSLAFTPPQEQHEDKIRRAACATPLPAFCPAHACWHTHICVYFFLCTTQTSCLR